MVYPCNFAFIRPPFAASARRASACDTRSQATRKIACSFSNLRPLNPSRARRSNWRNASCSGLFSTSLDRLYATQSVAHSLFIFGRECLFCHDYALRRIGVTSPPLSAAWLAADRPTRTSSAVSPSCTARGCKQPLPYSARRARAGARSRPDSIPFVERRRRERPESVAQSRDRDSPSGIARTGTCFPIPA